jgi:hypothetical protein
MSMALNTGGMNNFDPDLLYSIEENDSEKLDELYRSAFPHLLKIEVVTDIVLQKKGIDKILHLTCGKRLFIDEKKRRKDYGDILLEEYSDFDRKKVGWLGRDKHTDYIVYAIISSQKAYFLPFVLLQKTWISNYKNWLIEYGRKFAENKGYRTSNIPVPVDVLLKAMGDEMICNLNNSANA